MNPKNNPFAPGAGSRPPELAGRDDILEAASVMCARAMGGRYSRSMIMLGLRGTGKTVLLNAIGKDARQNGLIVSKIEAPEDGSLAKLLHPEMRRVMRALSTIEQAKDVATRGLKALRGFASIFKIKISDVEIGIEPEFGVADSGDLEFDLPDLFRLIGEAAIEAKKGWLILIDEVQYLSQRDFSALIVAMHHVSQEGLPIVLVGAGLPQVARLAGEAKSYAERLFLYPRIGPLSAKDASLAIEKPVQTEGCSIEQGALDKIVRETQGYPFFLQEWAYQAWDEATGETITVADVERAYSLTLASLDDGFFRVRMDRLTKMENEFVKVMALSGDGPYQVSDIAKAMGRKISSLGVIRAGLISKGMVYSPSHGLLAFTVPLFASFVRRQV